MATTAKEFGLIGKKIGMTQVFDEEGNVVPVTVIQIAENLITDIKTKEKHGYNAVQIGGFTSRAKVIKKPVRAALEKKSLPLLRKLKEFRSKNAIEGLNIGDALNAEEFFQDLKKVSITGKSIGKGFQGCVKLHNMHVGRRSHGSKSKRQIGSLGAGTTPGRVFPGKRMPAMMGNEVVTIAKAKVFKYDAEKRLLLLRGPALGKTGNIITIKPFGYKKWNADNK